MQASPNFRKDLYILYTAFIAFVLAAPLLPLTFFVAFGAILRRKKAMGTVYENHFTWLVRTIGFMWIAALIIVLPVWGFPTINFLMLPLIWSFYRVIKGIFMLYKNRTIENPKAFF